MATIFLVRDYSDNGEEAAADSYNSLRDLLTSQYGEGTKTPTLKATGFSLVIDEKGKEVGSVEIVSVWTRRKRRRGFQIRL